MFLSKSLRMSINRPIKHYKEWTNTACCLRSSPGPVRSCCRCFQSVSEHLPHRTAVDDVSPNPSHSLLDFIHMRLARGLRTDEHLLALEYHRSATWHSSCTPELPNIFALVTLAMDNIPFTISALFLTGRILRLLPKNLKLRKITFSFYT